MMNKKSIPNNPAVRLTPRVPELLARKVRSLAAARGETLEQLIVRVLERETAKSPLPIKISGGPNAA